MKKIIIIGGTGFLGFHIANFFSKKKIKVISVSRKMPKKNRRVKKVKYLYSDISKKEKLYSVLEPHLDASYIVNTSGEVDHKNFKKNYKSHFLGLKNIIDIFRDKNIEKFIQIGSSMEYGLKKSPQKESDKTKPLSAYGKAKLLATNYLIKISKKNKIPVFVLRAYQVYGPNQDSNRLIPFVISQCLKGKKFPCSSGTQYRDFLYINDFIRCIELILRKKIQFAQIFNIGSGSPIKVKNVINLINKKIKSGEPNFNQIRFRKEEQKYVFPSLFKIKKVLKWRPKISFNNGINKTISYYERNK